jgi:hypothetical protein
MCNPWRKLGVVLLGFCLGVTAALAQSSAGAKGPVRQPSDAAQPLPALTPLELKYQEMFREITALDQVSLAASGKDAGPAASLAAWLTPEQVLLVKLVAAHCVRTLQDTSAASLHNSGNSQTALPPGRLPRLSPEQRRDQVEQARQILADHIQQLKEALGPAGFAKLESYVQQRSLPATDLPTAAPARPQ